MTQAVSWLVGIHRHVQNVARMRREVSFGRRFFNLHILLKKTRKVLKKFSTKSFQENEMTHAILMKFYDQTLQNKTQTSTKSHEMNVNEGDDYLLCFASFFFLDYLLFFTTFLGHRVATLFLRFLFFVRQRSLFLTSDLNILNLLTSLC